MKYIKTYKVFESIVSSIDDIKDILIDISDDGIEVKIGRINVHVTISIGDEHSDLEVVDVLKYEDPLLRVIDFIESNGYKFVAFSYDDRGFIKVIKDGDIKYTIGGETRVLDLKTYLINNTIPTNYLRLFFNK